jgi:diguanylate cyclase (GGDEF)-like protein
MPLAHLAATEPERLLELLAVQSAIAVASSDLMGVLTVVAERAAAVTGADAGVVAIVDGDDLVVRGVSGTARGLTGARLSLATSLAGRTVREGRVQRSNDIASDERVDRATARVVGARSMLCVPLCHAGRAVGLLEVYADRPGVFSDTDVTVLDALSAVIAAHLNHAVELERRWHESRQDMLTDLGNRRAYEERLHKEVARAERYGHPLALVLLDLDGFKAVNDAGGHPAGDAVLREVGDVLRGVRCTDDCFRIGGDEFALLLPDTALGGGRTVAGRVTAAIAGAGRVTASAGVAAAGGADADALHATADEDLLAAKRQQPGRA